jgi:hypothetical protein
MAHLSKTVRSIGWVWVVLAPIIFGMAAISTVRSIGTYYAQLAAFSAIAVAALVFGLSAAFGMLWARRGLVVLSWLGCIYFCGSSLLMTAYTAAGAFQSGVWPALLFFAVVASVFALGVPFYLMAKALRRAAIHESGGAA